MSHPDLLIAMKTDKQCINRGNLVAIVKQIRRTATVDEAVTMFIAYIKTHRV